MGFALCEHELCGDCTISTAVDCVVLLYVCVGWLTCHASGLPRGFYSVAGMVYCSLPEFTHPLPFFCKDLAFASGFMKLCLLCMVCSCISVIMMSALCTQWQVSYQLDALN